MTTLKKKRCYVSARLVGFCQCIVLLLTDSNCTLLASFTPRRKKYQVATDTAHLVMCAQPTTLFETCFLQLGFSKTNRDFTKIDDYWLRFFNPFLPRSQCFLLKAKVEADAVV